MKSPLILGIWDGHDSGAALVAGDRILAAVNEERLSRRKLEVRFPEGSIAECLRLAGASAADVSRVGLTTTDPAKTLGRLFPSLKENYYLFRRRKSGFSRWAALKRRFKYRVTELRPNALCRALSAAALRPALEKAGLRGKPVSWVDHHAAHAAAAAFCSGYEKALVFTLDGVGDGLSGTISILEGGNLRRAAELGAGDSLGIFFEQVTTLLNLRELEDEGKVMALSNYAYPVEDRDNPLLDYFAVDGLRLRARHRGGRMFAELQRVLWSFPSEQFAFMAQRTLEVKIRELVGNAVKETGLSRVAMAGGVASNVKVNRLVKELPGVSDVFVFPHMGDGGQAAGAALWVNHEATGAAAHEFRHAYLGPEFGSEEIEEALRGQEGLTYERASDIESRAARSLCEGEIVLWFQGRMEFGPRALGHRSILARPDSEDVRDRLNGALKRRAWYQPFCPSLLEEDAGEILEDFRGVSNRFMTMSYMVKARHRPGLRAVVHVDGSCRPQMVGPDDDPLFFRLLREVKRLTGRGIVLNTSFNIHGEPVVRTPRDAVRTLRLTKADRLAIGDFWVSRA